MNYDEKDDYQYDEMNSLPNFIPPDKQEEKAPADQAEVPAAIIAEDVAPMSDMAPTGDVANEAIVTASESGEKTVEQPEAENKNDTDAPVVEASDDSTVDVQQTVVEQNQEDDHVMVNRDALEALMAIAKEVNASPMVDPDELQRVNAAVQGGGMPGVGMTQGQQQLKTGVQAVAEGGMSLLGGVAALTGEALKAGSKVFSSVSGAFKEDGKNDVAPASAGVAVLPRISEYRVEQSEKAANAYGDALKKFWSSGNLPNVRKEIEERARQTGLSVEDVMDKMKPNGEMIDLYDKFRAAVAESPDAQSHKKSMDKALDGWVRQYGRGQEELLNPETDGSPYFESLRDRLDKSHGRMQSNTANVPIFDGEEKSHAEKLKETIQRIMEKLKEIAKDFVNMVRGKNSADLESEHASIP